MFSILVIFIFASAISFIGSLQLGPVNLYVINTVLYHNKKSALFVAIGGCIPEFIYCSLAVYASQYIEQSTVVTISLKIVFILLMITIALLLFFRKKATAVIPNESNKSPISPLKSVLKGFSLAGFNPQLLPFWIFVQLYFNTVNLLRLKTEFHRFAFIFGAGFGAFALLMLLILLINNYKDRIFKFINHNYFYKTLSILFFVMAIQQTVSLIQLIQ